jgi:hypothetical protein
MCCRNCFKTKGYYITEDNKKHWTDEKGFWSPEGCKLPREDMPQGCKAYDCKEHRWCMEASWKDKWNIVTCWEIPDDKQIRLLNIKGEQE